MAHEDGLCRESGLVHYEVQYSAAVARRFKYIADMKFRVVVSLMIALTAMLAVAQSQPAAETKRPLFFLKIAADVAGNVQSQPLNGFFAIYIDDKNWKAAEIDSDLGPFLKKQEAKPRRSAGCLFSSSKDAAICVYFDGDVAFGVAAVRVGPSGKIEAGDVAAAYKSVSKDMVKRGGEDLTFTEGNVNADDGTPLPAFQITSKKPSDNGSPRAGRKAVVHLIRPS